ncbi:MAG TPA: PilZ domain-containing protein [Phycisphaerae bacterium]|nr:PilZ domain-containing protein [Phycisphaerae bacterium]
MSSKRNNNPEVQAQTEEITRILVDAARHAAGDFYGGKRTHKRFFASNPFEADAEIAEDHQQFPVTLHDVSASGLSCWSKHRLDEDAPVRVREFTSDDSGVWLSARVTHCTPGIRGFLVGAQFDYPAEDDVLEQLAAESEPQPVPAAPPSWWRRILNSLGIGHQPDAV